MPDLYENRELARFIHERELLDAYPVSELTEIIREVGFSCNECGRCCTSGQNGHVFLLEEDTDKALEICPDALIPAPFFEICDKKGHFYVSGYALRTHPDGSCIHLDQGRCRIYQDRFSICRVYPYMLHREPDEKGRLEFRQISGLNEHGAYHHEISQIHAQTLAEETIAYERAWLDQMIGFYHGLNELFHQSGDRHVRKTYDLQMRQFTKGGQVDVFVYHKKQFIRHQVTIDDYSGIITR